MRKNWIMACMGGLLVTTPLMMSCSDDFPREPKKEWTGEQGVDENAQPGSRFYQYAAGAWMNQVALKDGQKEWSLWAEAELDAQNRLRSMYQGSSDELVQTYTLMAQDKLNRKEKSADALTGWVNQIQQAVTREAMMDAIATLQTAGYSPFFEIGIAPNEYNMRTFLPILKVAGTHFPASLYQNVAFQEDYANQLASTYVSLFPATDFTTALQMARDAVAMQVKLQQAHVQQAYQVKTRDTRTSSSMLELLRLCGISTTCLYDAATDFDQVIDLLENNDLKEMRNYMLMHLVEENMYFLSFEIMDQWLAFEQKYQTNSAYYQRHQNYSLNEANAEDAWANLNALVPELVGRLYAGLYIKSTDREIMEDLAGELNTVFQKRMSDSIVWMSEETRAKAFTKMNRMQKLLLAPSKWPESSYVEIGGDNYCAATNELRRAAYDHKKALMGADIQSKAWEFVLHEYPLFEVNCMYEPRMNMLYASAAFSCSQFFVAQAAYPDFYGRGGFWMARSMVKGFNEVGSMYNETGSKADWWKYSERTAFEMGLDSLAAYYSSFPLVGQAYTRGDLCASEASADLGGLQVACDAFRKNLKERVSDKNQQLEETRQFFVSYAQTLAKVATDEWKLDYYASSPYAFDGVRVEATVPQVAAWYEAFGITANDKLYLPQAKRSRLW